MRHSKAIIVLQAALCVCLGFTAPIQAQLSRVWSYDLGTLGWPGLPDDRAIHIDDSGYCYILSYINGQLGGALVTVIRPDSTLAWQYSFPDSGLILSYSAPTAAGDVYVVGGHQDEGLRVSAVALKVSAGGTLAWSKIITPVMAPFFNIDPYAAVDINGRLWMAVTESPVDSFCIDSLPDGYGDPGRSAVHSSAVLYRLDAPSGMPVEMDRIAGEDQETVAFINLKADADGHVDVDYFIQEYCCNLLCQHCRDSCFTQPTGLTSTARNSRYLRPYTLDGGQGFPTWLSATDNQYYTSWLMQGSNGAVLIGAHQYMSSQPYWTYLSRPGHWSVTYPGETISPTQSRISFDDQDHLYTIAPNASTLSLDQSTSLNKSNLAYILRQIDGTTGSILWAKVVPWGTLGGDREGNCLLLEYTGIVHRFDASGNETWTYNLGQPATFLGADTLGHVYYRAGNQLIKYSTRKTFTIRDAAGDSLADMQFAFIRLADAGPTFAEDTLGRFTTDDHGTYSLGFITDNTFEAVLDSTTDTLAIGNGIKISRILDDSAAVKHVPALGTAYSLHLDNMAIDSMSIVTYDTLTDEADQEIYLTHTEVRYNLLVSLDWDASVEYLQGLETAFRRMSNYLYDVTDGQARLDTVAIYDDRYLWDQADIQLHAKNTVHPCANVKGIHDPVGIKTVTLGRKWFGNETDCRNYSYDEHPLVVEADIFYRTIAHELGHYALGFYDEYLFVNNGVHCPTVLLFGFMESQYYGAGPYSSEMSSAFSYTDPACRNTEQYAYNNAPCWNQFEAQFQHRYTSDSIRAPIIKPDDPERQLLNGIDILDGPNLDPDNPASLDFDAGARVVFSVPPAPPAAGVKTLNLQILNAGSGLPEPNIEVVLHKGALGVTIRDIDQGATSDLGTIYVLGAEDGDVVQVAGRVDTLGIELAASSPTSMWAYGEATVGAGGISRLGNRFALSAAEDTATIETRLVAGDYPLILAPVIGPDSLLLSVWYLNPFSAPPSAELRPDGDSAITRPLTLQATLYGAALTDSAGPAGSILVWGTDDSAHTFPATADYLASGYARHLIGPYGGAEVYLDSTAAALDKSVIVSSSYPPLRAGLPAGALQAGRVHALACTPASAADSATMLIRYDDADLGANQPTRGDETSLAIFQWDGATWNEIGGTVDTSENTVYAVIPGPGVYAAFTTAVVVGVEEPGEEILPVRFELSQNWPNPFNPVTTIRYALDEPGRVQIEIFNVLGQKVRTLVDEMMPAGAYTLTWDGTDAAGRSASTGVYLYRFTSGDVVLTRKMLLLK